MDRTVKENLDLLRSTKADIKAAIENKGVTVGDVPYSQYAEKIGEISGGGEGITEEQYTEGVNFSVLSNNAKKVKYGAFYYDTTLTEVNLPQCSTVSTFGFAYCSNLSKVSLPICETLGSSVFANCSKLTEIYCPNVYSIGGSVFTSCSALPSVTLNILSGNYQLFTNCSSLSIVSLPLIASAMASNMFNGCSKLSEVYMATETYIIPSYNSVFASTALSAFRSSGTIYVAAQNYSRYIVSAGWSSLSSRIVAYGDTTVPMLSVDADKRLYGKTKYLVSAFSTYVGVSYTEITGIDLPECLHIESSALTSCKNITTVNIPNCLRIGSQAFQSCGKITEINLPVCKSVYYNAFSQCTNLSIVNIPECIFLGSGVFAYCKSIQSIDLPVCSSIGSNAFAYDNLLKTVNIPACTYMGNSAFTNCSLLQSIDLPVCSIISTTAFVGCSMLESVYLRYSSVCQGAVNMFLVTPMSNSTYLGHYGSIYVPASLVDAYKTAEYWSVYANRITAIPE